MTDCQLPSPFEAALAREDCRPSTRLVYGALYEHDAPLTRSELAERTGLHRWTVGESVTALAEADWVVTDTRLTTGPGRPPETYRARVACPECGERFLGRQGVIAHHGHVHGVAAQDLIGRAGEFGEDPSPPPRLGETDG